MVAHTTERRFSPISISRLVEEQFKKTGIKRGSKVVFQSGAFGEAVFEVVHVRKNKKLTLECIVGSREVSGGYRLRRPVEFSILTLVEGDK